ncbi:MAG: hypothetical protein LBJ10_08565, partial [Clostridiales bacterium]|nr:hypothetical protein [Clostridiales bacterium]
AGNDLTIAAATVWRLLVSGQAHPGSARRCADSYGEPLCVSPPALQEASFRVSLPQHTATARGAGMRLPCSGWQDGWPDGWPVTPAFWRREKFMRAASHFVLNIVN